MGAQRAASTSKAEMECHGNGLHCVMASTPIWGNCIVCSLNTKLSKGKRCVLCTGRFCESQGWSPCPCIAAGLQMEKE